MFKLQVAANKNSHKLRFHKSCKFYIQGAEYITNLLYIIICKTELKH